MHVNTLCSLVNGCQFSICCKFASTHFFFLHLCSSVWMQPTRNWCSYSAVSQHSLTQTLRQHCWPCFYDRLLFSEIARAEQQINCTHVMVDILLCFPVTPSHCECWCDWILVFLLYFVFQLHPSRVCTRAVLQLFDKTDVGMVSEVFWQEPLLRVVQQHQGHNALVYSWRLIRAQVDQTAPPFLMKKALHGDIKIKPWLFPSAFSNGATGGSLGALVSVS